MNPYQRPQSFQWLYERHFRLVWSVVGQLGLAGAAREDAVQEIWLTILRRLDTLESDASAQAWVCSIAREVVVWRLRRNAQLRDGRVSVCATEPLSKPSCAARRYEVTAEVEEALAVLSEEQRAVLVMASVHGLTAPDISTTLGLPVNTVHSRLRLARRRLETTSANEPEIHRALASEERPPQRMRGAIWFLLQPALGERVKPAVVAGSVWSIPKAVALGMALGAAGVAAVMLPSDTAQASSPPAVAVRAPLATSASHSYSAAPARLAMAPLDEVVPSQLGPADGALVRVLCSLERAEQAAQNARRLTSGSPGSPVATAVEAGFSTRCETRKSADGDGSDAASR